MPLDPNKKYVPLSGLDKLLQQLGYKEELSVAAGRHYVMHASNAHLPPTITIAYPQIAVDGTHWISWDEYFDLLDRLSDLDPEEHVILRAIRHLDS